MRIPSTTVTAPAAHIAGATYIAASVGFMLVFSWLAAHFGYPEVLDGQAKDVLPALHALGNDGRAVWAIYALLPLALLPAVAGAADALRTDDLRNEAVVRLGVLLQGVAALCMTLGLARWSTAQWALASAWPAASAAERASITLVFDALNAYLGNGIGEFVGEFALYGSFAAFAIALLRLGVLSLAAFAAVTALAGWVGMFRNITPTVQFAADITNLLLPLFLIVFGVALIRGRTASRSRPQLARMALTAHIASMSR
jgi:hypothetical protein